MVAQSDYGSLLDALRGVTWPARRPPRAAVHGTHHSRLLGTSPEFSEYRPYRQGEDPRRLDWKLLARTDRAYLRLTTDRALLSTMVVLDASASMAFPAPALDKWAHACRIAIGLMSIAHASGDPVGLVVPTTNGPRAMAARTRRGVVGEAVRLIDGIEPSGSPRLDGAVAALPAGSRVVIVSDFLGDDTALFGAARQRLSAGGEVYALHVLARDELDPSRGTRLVADPEHPDDRRTLDDAGRSAYRDAFDGWRAELAHLWRAAGATYIEMPDDEPADRAVRRVAHQGTGR
jgi:uncharacterized protein (DUF58 family)